MTALFERPRSRPARRAGALLAAALSLVGCASPVGTNATNQVETPPPASTLRVLLVSDPHFDPFRNPALARRLAAAPVEAWYDLLRTDEKTPFATVGRDTNASLLVSSLGAMKRWVWQPDAVMVSGDLLAHDFRARYVGALGETSEADFHRFVDKTTDFIPVALHRMYPKAQLLPTVGNNDGYCGDYQITPRDRFLRHQAERWRPFVDVDGRAPDFAREYAAEGFYQARLANGVRVLGVDSVVYSASYDNECGEANQHPPQTELAWLDARVDEAPATPTVLLMHIPPGIDPFKSFLQLGKPKPFYAPDAQAALAATLRRRDPAITTIVSGHLHNVAYRVLAPRDTPDAANLDRGIPIYSGPSISPIFGNAPAFATLDITKNATIDNLTVYELQSNVLGLNPRPSWHVGYDFNRRYGLHGVTAPSIRRLHEREQTDLRLRETVQRDRVSGGPAGVVGRLQWRTAWCAEVAMTPESYLACEGVPTP